MTTPGRRRSSGTATLTLSLCILLTMTLNGQPAISFEDWTNSGVALLPPGSTSFLEALSSRMDSEGRNAIGPIEPYLVIIRNDARKPLVAAVIRYERFSQTGEVSHANSVWLTTQNHERRKAHPGEMILMGPFGGFCRVLRDRLGMADSAGASADIARRAAEFSRDSAVRIALDSVTFDDGTLLGEDRAGWQSTFREYLRAEREIREETLKLSHPSRHQYLMGLVEPAALPVELEPHATEAYLSHREMTARILLNLLNNSNSEAQFLAWMNQAIGNPVPDPRRGK